MTVRGGMWVTMLAVAAIAAPAMATSVKDGVDAWQRGDYAGAITAWKPLAEAGDADAAFNLAQAYKLGRGVPTDLKQAKLWYGKSAQAGHVQGAANYGLLLFQDGDRKAAMPWIEKAADAGDPRAQYVYGTALFNGDLAPRDWPRAYGLMTRAAAAGLPQATTSLSQMDQFLSADDRKKGLEIAAHLASQPVPPTGRHLVTAGASLPAPTPIAKPGDLSAPAPAPAKASPLPVKPKLPEPRPSPPSKTPAPKPAPAQIATGGAWAVQLGAYGTQEKAAAAWSSLSGKAPALKGLKPSYEKAGAVVRLRAGGLADKATAEKACSAATAAGGACFPVAP